MIRSWAEVSSLVSGRSAVNFGDCHLFTRLDELALAGGNEVGRLIRGVIDRRPRAGHDHRQTAGHRLDDRQNEPPAAERVHQALAAATQLPGGNRTR